MHQLNTQKSILDHPECRSCTTSHCTGPPKLVCGLDQLVEQLARIFKTPALRSSQQPESSKI